MKKNKINWEEDEDNPDVYDEEGLEVSQENDEISDEEAAFMSGYMGGGENEEDIQ